MSVQDHELDTAFPRDSWRQDLADAIDLARDQGQVTWLTENGKRIAAIVPVDVAGHLDGIVFLREDPLIQEASRLRKEREARAVVIRRDEQEGSSCP